MRFGGSEMRQMVDTILKKYGTDVQLLRDREEWTIRGFFQPVDSISWQSIEHAASPLGHSSRPEYTCIAPADTDLQAGDVLLIEGRNYLARRVEAYHYHGQVIYRWALCVEKGRADNWGL